MCLGPGQWGWSPLPGYDTALDEPGKISLRQCPDVAGPQSTGAGSKAVQECVHMGKVPRLRDPELLMFLQL